jgi:hypothetical protein
VTDSDMLACSLSGPELSQRIREWSEVAARARSRYVEKDRIVSIYPPDEGLRKELRRLIDAEAQCCSFMEFDVAEEPDQVVVELRVPHDMSEALAVMLGSVTRKASQAV